MGYFQKRRLLYKETLKQLEELLISKGATPSHLFQDGNLLKFLACVPYNRFLNFLRISTVNIHLNREEKAFVDFILIFKTIRQRQVNFLLDAVPDIKYYDSPTLGWKENKRYADEMKIYLQRLKEYKLEEEELEQQRKALLKTPDGLVYLYVKTRDSQGALAAAAITEGQRQRAQTVESQLNALTLPPFRAFPVKKKPIYIRLTYDGQIFIKDGSPAP